MQRLEERIDAKINGIKAEILGVVDEDFKERRKGVNREFLAKSRAKAAQAAAQANEGVEQSAVGGQNVAQAEADAELKEEEARVAEITA